MFVARSLRRMRNEPRQELVAGLKPRVRCGPSPPHGECNFFGHPHDKIIQNPYVYIHTGKQWKTYSIPIIHRHTCMYDHVTHTNLAASSDTKLTTSNFECDGSELRLMQIDQCVQTSNVLPIIDMHSITCLASRFMGLATTGSFWMKPNQDLVLRTFLQNFTLLRN